MKLHPSNVREQFLACETALQCDMLREAMRAELKRIPDEELSPNPARLVKTRWMWTQTIEEQWADRKKAFA